MLDWRRCGGALAALPLGVLLAVAPAIGFDGTPSPERQVELMHRLRHDCGSCHGMTMKGGLGPALLPAALEGKEVDALAAIMRDGVPGTPMPPWGFELSEAEAMWLAVQLKQGLGP